MEKLKMMSKDKVQENISKIQKMFPNAVTEVKRNGKVQLAVDFDVLKQELADTLIDERELRYQFTWPDKQKAVLLANMPISATLRPCKEESVDFDNTQNLYIEGDNLDVLKLLQETYLGKIKMIYIDPPYNTGNDFVYNDDFAQSADEYAENSGQFDNQGNRLVQNTESNGRFHTDWLNMIYPRLRLAKDLLADDGVIFISIGEHEIDGLKKIATEIFGASNFIETYIWESTFRPDNSSPILRRNAEYVMCLAKNIMSLTKFIGEIKDKEGLPSLTKASMKESILTFPANIVKTLLPDSTYNKGVRDSYELLDDAIVKNGIIINEFRLKGHMIWGQEYLLKEIKNGTEIIIKGEGFVPYTKKQGDSIMSPTKIIPNHIVGDILSANTECAKLFETRVFSYPKPVTLIKYLLGYLGKSDDIVLDFFSGSATTAHAVMQLNAEDGGKRKFIMVQLPENLDENLIKAYNSTSKKTLENAIKLCDELGKKHYLTEVAKERIRRAGLKILQPLVTGAGRADGTGYGMGMPTSESEWEYITKNVLDIGFRVLKLDSSNIKDVDKRPDQYTQMSLDDMADNIKEDRTPLDLIFQVMLELGKPLSAKIEEKIIAGKKVFIVDDNDLIACFDNDVTDEVVNTIAQLKPLYAVFRDSSLSNDSTAANFDQIFATYSPTTIRKVL